MKLKTIASNMTELNFNGVSIMFSYDTPVAGWDNQGAFKTSEHYSPTTSKHINKYLGKDKDMARTVSQSYINSLVA
tara:strand:+ start:275 stop:502 length:228 start_codon:yes stop_codon:yes gene_type:complete